MGLWLPKTGGQPRIIVGCPADGVVGLVTKTLQERDKSRPTICSHIYRYAILSSVVRLTAIFVIDQEGNRHFGLDK